MVREYLITKCINVSSTLMASAQRIALTADKKVQELGILKDCLHDTIQDWAKAQDLEITDLLENE